jgi:macrolide-specific efflux system membrane fusion protein
MNRARMKKIGIYLGVLAVAIGGASYALTHRTKIQKITYHEDTVVKDDFTQTIVSTGAVAPENRLDIKPPVAGRMDQLLVVEGQQVKQGQVLAWVSSNERAAMLDSARAEGPESLKQWQTYYKATPIYAPIDGIIILQNIWPGQTFATTDAILTMSDRLTVKAQVDETDIAKIVLGQIAEITLDAYPNEKIAAKVVHTAFDAKTVNSVTTYIVDVLPTKVPRHMLSGMTANVTFILKSIPDALMIPNEAVQTENGITCVRVKPESPELPAKCVPVTLGPSTEGDTVVMNGLVEDQTILIPDLKPVPAKNADASKNPFMNSGPKGPRH